MLPRITTSLRTRTHITAVLNEVVRTVTFYGSLKLLTGRGAAGTPAFFKAYNVCSVRRRIATGRIHTSVMKSSESLEVFGNDMASAPDIILVPRQSMCKVVHVPSVPRSPSFRGRPNFSRSSEEESTNLAARNVQLDNTDDNGGVFTVQPSPRTSRSSSNSILGCQVVPSLTEECY